jgi:ATP-binding cassette subfamily B multidrug efflux pump
MRDIWQARAPIRSFLRTARYTGKFVFPSFQRRRWNGMSSKKQALDKNRSRETLKRILKYISQYRWSVIFSLFLALVTVALTLYVPILTGQAVDRIVSSGHVDFAGLKGILMKILGAVAITSVSQWLMNHINNIITYRVVKDIRTRAFNHLEVMPLSYIDVHPSGDIISRIIADIDQFSEGLLMGFTQLFTGLLTIAGTLLFMLSIQPAITAVVVVLTPISLFVASFIAKKTFVMFRKQSETRGELTSLTDEMLGNMKVVQAFGHQEEAQKEFEEINDRLAGYSLRATFFSSITNPATRFVNSLVYAAVGITGAYGAIRGFITVGQLTSFLSYANQYTKPFNEISGVVTELQNALASAARVFELIDERTIIEDREDAEVLCDVKGGVELKQVCFSYTPEKKLIEDFNLSVQPGQRVAIVGPTGCGKTTIINLLMRFYDVDSGAIEVEGTDIRNVTRESLRTSYGMVLQDTWLKSGTIRDNIAYGHPEASEEEIIQAARQAHAHGFIMRMPDGYGTVISEDGGNLSQGQKQLLCIARVMLCLPPMLILDEATSSIDTRTEIKVQKAFARMMEGRTSFIVAHRLSTIREADVILVMRDGRIVEKGRHEELLGMNGFYADIYNAQFVRG